MKVYKGASFTSVTSDYDGEIIPENTWKVQIRVAYSEEEYEAYQVPTSKDIGRALKTVMGELDGRNLKDTVGNTNTEAIVNYIANSLIKQLREEIKNFGGYSWIESIRVWETDTDSVELEPYVDG